MNSSVVGEVKSLAQKVRDHIWQTLSTTVDGVVADYRYGDFKKAVADAVIEELEPFQNRYKQILESKEYEAVLKDGAKKASEIANVTLRRVQKAIGLLGK